MMTNENVKQILNSMLDKLADIEHERWSHWQSYLHSCGKPQPDGSLVLPADLVKKWSEQINTRYEDLSEAEKESDRAQVRKYLPLIAEAFSDAKPLHG